MKITYDAEVDALYIRFRSTQVETKHIEDGLAIDYDAEDRVAGIEILDVKLRVSGGEKSLKQIEFDDFRGTAKRIET